MTVLTRTLSPRPAPVRKRAREAREKELHTGACPLASRWLPVKFSFLLIGRTEPTHAEDGIFSFGLEFVEYGDGCRRK
jgi:hypothetical protein